MSSAPWQASVRTLRRRAILSGGLRALGQMSLPGMFLVFSYLVLCRYSPWARFLAPGAGVLMLAALLTASLLGAIRARHSELYFAKWIDLESRLDDRLSSAVEWSQLRERDPFQERCLEQFGLDLGAGRWQLILPRTRPPRVSLTLITCLSMLGVVAMYVRRPALVYEKDARQLVVVSRTTASSVKQDAAALEAQAKVLADPEIEHVATELSTLVDKLDGGKMNRESALATLEQLRRESAKLQQRTRALSELSGGGPAGGAGGALARALSAGDAEGAAKALDQVRESVAEGNLSPQELDQIRGVLGALATVADGSDASLGGQLRATERALEAGNFSEAAQLLAGAQNSFSALRPVLAARATAAKAESLVRQLEHATQDVADAARSGSSEVEPPEGVGTSKHSNPGLSDVPDNSRGSQAASEHSAGERPDPAQKGPRMEVAAAISGKVLRELFESPSMKASSTEVQQLAVDHRRVVEDRFEHDEIPEEYHAAVRAYFAALK